MPYLGFPLLGKGRGPYNITTAAVRLLVEDAYFAPMSESRLHCPAALFIGL
jgi:hypothetical protein